MDEQHKEGAGAMPFHDPLEGTETEHARDQDSDLSMLFDQALSDATEGMSEEEATAYIASLFEQRELDSEHSLFAYVTPDVTSSMAVTNYRPDQAVPEASRAQNERWH